MGILRVEKASGRLEALTGDRAEIVLYQQWREFRCTVGDLARQALAALRERP